MQLPHHIREVFKNSTQLYTREVVEAALDRMAREIHRELDETNPIFLCVMVGGLIPAGNLLTRIDFPLELDYVHATRYQSGTSGGVLEFKIAPNDSLKDRTVLVIDDILDRGVTLKGVVDHCKKVGAKRVHTAVLVDKEVQRAQDGIQEADFTGLRVDDRYVFGYGMDYKEYLRNVPGVYAVADQHL